jgi:hypothetical protein|tara:strand:+ start:951 stop:1121 length:171 start_codon:yes stop_codon:yes gene_type:complete
MAGINIPRLPTASDEYDSDQFNNLIRSLDQLILLLNSSYTPEVLRNEDEQISWFLS